MTHARPGPKLMRWRTSPLMHDMPTRNRTWPSAAAWYKSRDVSQGELVLVTLLTKGGNVMGLRLCVVSWRLRDNKGWAGGQQCVVCCFQYMQSSESFSRRVGFQ